MTHANKRRAKIPRMANLADRRLIAMLKKMRDDLGAVRGWNKSAHERTGIPKETVSRLVNGRRLGVDKDTLEIVIAKMRMKREYFTDKRLKDPDYRDFILSSNGNSVTIVEAKSSPGTTSVDQTATFEAMLDALRATDEERAAWQDYREMFPMPYRTATHVQDFIGGLRSGLRMQAAIDRATTQSAESEMRASGRRKIDDTE
jgi:hypothetical protein